MTELSSKEASIQNREYALKKAISVFFNLIPISEQHLTILIAEDTISQKHDMLLYRRTQVTSTKNGFSLSLKETSPVFFFENPRQLQKCSGRIFCWKSNIIQI